MSNTTPNSERLSDDEQLVDDDVINKAAENFAGSNYNRNHNPLMWNRAYNGFVAGAKNIRVIYELELALLESSNKRLEEEKETMKNELKRIIKQLRYHHDIALNSDADEIEKFLNAISSPNTNSENEEK